MYKRKKMCEEIVPRGEQIQNTEDTKDTGTQKEQMC